MYFFFLLELYKAHSLILQIVWLSVELRIVKCRVKCGSVEGPSPDAPETPHNFRRVTTNPYLVELPGLAKTNKQKQIKTNHT